MNCGEISERLSEYWDMPEDNELRESVDRHIIECSACREEFEMWQESAELIQSTRDEETNGLFGHAVSSNVMARIYKDESWRLPVAFRTYTFSVRVRRNIMACVAMCLAIFVVSFMYSFGTGTTGDADYADFTGIIETAHAKSTDLGGKSSVLDGIQVASISAPSILTVGPIQSYTDYLLATSIIGFVITLLLMNWLSRLRA